MSFVELESVRRGRGSVPRGAYNELVSVRWVARKKNGPQSPVRDSLLVVLYHDAMSVLKIGEGNTLGFQLDHKTLDLRIYNKSGMLTAKNGRSVRIYNQQADGSYARGVVEVSCFLINSEDTCRRIAAAIGDQTKYLPFRTYASSREQIRTAIDIRLTDPGE
jgi:hypothetical protein